MIKLNKQDLISEVLHCFDFAEVAMTMRYLNWTWANSKTQGGVPSIPELTSKSSELLSQAYDVSSTKEEGIFFVSTGGFKASAEKYPDGEIVLWLEFVLTDCNYSNKDTCY